MVVSRAPIFLSRGLTESKSFVAIARLVRDRPASSRADALQALRIGGNGAGIPVCPFAARAECHRILA